MEEPVTSKVFTENPFSYNFLSLKRSEVNDKPIPNRDTVVASADANMVGKMMGLKTPAEWNKNYDKIYLITEWAKERSGLKDPQSIVGWIDNMYKYSIPLGNSKIERLYNNIRKMKENVG